MHLRVKDAKVSVIFLLKSLNTGWSRFYLRNTVDESTTSSTLHFGDTW